MSLCYVKMWTLLFTASLRLNIHVENTPILSIECRSGLYTILCLQLALGFTTLICNSEAVKVYAVVHLLSDYFLFLLGKKTLLRLGVIYLGNEQGWRIEGS